MEQKDVQRKMPSDRFNVDAFYHPDGTNKGTVCLANLCLLYFTTHVKSSELRSPPVQSFLPKSLASAKKSVTSLLILRLLDDVALRCKQYSRVIHAYCNLDKCEVWLFS